MKQNKCNAYTAKETLDYRGRKLYVSAARRAAKIVENQIGTTGEARTPTKNQNASRRS